MLQINDKAPNFSLRNQNDELINLKDYNGKKVILYFYPKDNTPGCTTQACSFRDYNALLKDLNVVTLGISYDDLKSHSNFHSKYNLNFDILSDTNHVVAKEYGVYKEKNLIGKKLPSITRSTFIINENGYLEKAMYNVSAQNNPKEVYEYLKNNN